ncbi:MAG: caspase family protein [Candidatus Parabeggiatoa sp.]|nr:caspase family protein [Candidatus Parabeggiatoa sp.]
MRILILCLLTISFFQACTSYPIQSSGEYAQEQGVALVIGNSRYQPQKPYPPPKKPVISFKDDILSAENDADQMSEKLRSLGFIVFKVKNANRATIFEALEKFKTQLLESRKQQDKVIAGLFYFSGHGMALDDETYLIPVGTKPIDCIEYNKKCLPDVNLLKKNTVTLGNVYTFLQRPEGRTETTKEETIPHPNFVILDSCRTSSSNTSSDNKVASNSNVHKDSNWKMKIEVKKANAIVLKGPKYDIEVEGANVGANQSLTMPAHTFLAYATAIDRPAVGSGIQDENSIYTRHLLEVLSQSGLSVSELFGEVNEAVKKTTKDMKDEYQNDNDPDTDPNDLIIQDPHFSSNEISSEVNFVFRQEAVNQAPRW